MKINKQMFLSLSLLAYTANSTTMDKVVRYDKEKITKVINTINNKTQLACDENIFIHFFNNLSKVDTCKVGIKKSADHDHSIQFTPHALLQAVNDAFTESFDTITIDQKSSISIPLNTDFITLTKNKPVMIFILKKEAS